MLDVPISAEVRGGEVHLMLGGATVIPLADQAADVVAALVGATR